MHSVPSGEKPEDRRAKAVRLPHETESEIPEKMHETTSEPGCPGAGAVHELKSEFREAVHEMESELTDRVARSILEGLRRTAAVR